MSLAKTRKTTQLVDSWEKYDYLKKLFLSCWEILFVWLVGLLEVVGWCGQCRKDFYTVIAKWYKRRKTFQITELMHTFEWEKLWLECWKWGSLFVVNQLFPHSYTCASKSRDQENMQEGLFPLYYPLMGKSNSSHSAILLLVSNPMNIPWLTLYQPTSSVGSDLTHIMT